MYRIAKRFEFSAAHWLNGLPEGHPCSRLHGHNYTVEVELQAETLDASGFVLDYGQLAPFKAYLDSTLDHRCLNEVLGFQPSVENLARYLFEWAKAHWPQVCAVRVSETPKSWGEYRS